MEKDVQGVWLEDLTWVEARQWFDRDPLVIIPIGAGSKEHGPHLPLKTDYLLARGFMDRVIAELPVVVAPVLTLGYYPAFRKYAGSQCITPGTYARMMREVMQGFVDQGIRNLMFFNTGVSTEATIMNTVREYEAETNIRVGVANILALMHAIESEAEQRMGTHADELETSIMMSMWPLWVHEDRLATDYGSGGRLSGPIYMPGYMNPEPGAGGVHHPTGIFGDATLASKEKGDRIVERIVSDLIAGMRAAYPMLAGFRGPET